MAPFDRSHTSSYTPSIVTMAISCIVCELCNEYALRVCNLRPNDVDTCFIFSNAL